MRMSSLHQYLFKHITTTEIVVIGSNRKSHELSEYIVLFSKVSHHKNDFVKILGAVSFFRKYRLAQCNAAKLFLFVNISKINDPLISISH